jgi:(4-alkanoyl-5-oxo-2,5-dihydrofuran-3-yl)methyl phosphate reductase
MSLVLVTGAAGNVGSRVVRGLAARGVRVRAFIRSGEAGPKGEGIEAFEGDLADRERVRAAVKGVSGIYLLATGLDLVSLEANVIDAAASEKVERLVKHSVQGAQYEAALIPRAHRASEKKIEQSKLPFTFLRPASFASNSLGWAGMLRGGDAVYGPYGEMALPVVDPGDIAAVAEKVLTEPGHTGKAYDLTGPEALTTAEQVAILAKALGRKLSFINVPDEAARKSMVDSGMVPGYADAMIDLVAMLRGLGRVEPTRTVSELLGRPATPFASFVESNLAAFR